MCTGFYKDMPQNAGKLSQPQKAAGKRLPIIMKNGGAANGNRETNRARIGRK